jgi:transglutaminase-like putative cysteine protease
MGLPLRFDHDVTVHWRGLSDLSQVRGEARDYTAESQVIDATPDELRQALLADVPDTILARYTALPNDVPERVTQLAQEAAVAGSGGQTTIYDQVKAIEQFLRQYPYSLDLPLPPRNQDLVDFFIFDLQSGYCDYYATSMVIMARSLGIPARFATGFLAQPPDENGIQQIYQLNAHSWAEVYFAGYGWVEFEPTAAFPTQGATSASPEFQPAQPPTFSNGGPLALPPAVESGSSSILTNGYFLVILALFMAAVGIMVWIMRGRHVEQDLVWGAYGRLQRSANWIGQPTPESQTPIEFEATFKNRLTQLTTKSQLARKLIEEGSTSASKFTSLSEEAAQLTDLYIARQYQRRNEAQEAKNDYTADLIWRRIRLRLWLLAVLNKLRRTR